VPFTGSSVAQLEAQGRELVIREANRIAELEVTRKVFVPATGYFARYLEILNNPTNADITVGVEVAADLDSEATTLVVDQQPDQWIVTDDDADNDRWPSSDPALAHVFAGVGVGVTLAPPLTTVPSASSDTLKYRWQTVTVPAHQRVAVMHFAVQQPSQTAAHASAIRLSQLPPEALADLSAEEIAAIGNFDVPADGVGTVPAIALAQNFNVTGQIFTGENKLIESSTTEVVLRSGNPIYSREAKVTTVSAFNLSMTVADSWTLEATNAPPPPFGGWKTPLQITKPVVAGQTSVTENVVFTGTATITGRVHFTNNSAPATGTIGIVPLMSGLTQIGNLPDGRFKLPVVPTGTYEFIANVNDRIARVPVTVPANASTDVDLRIPARTMVRLQVNNPGGASPASEARIVVSSNTTGAAGNADASGRYDVGNMDEGPFIVYAEEKTTSPSQKKHKASVRHVVRAEDDGVPIDLTVTLKALANLKAIVTRGGQRVQNAKVELRSSEDLDGRFNFAGFTNASGEVLMPDVSAGQFEVRVRDSMERVTLGTGVGVIADSAEGTTIEVPITLSDNPSTVKGTLFGADGQTALRRFSVWVYLFDGGREVGRLQTETGRYELTDVPAPAGGSLTLRAECDGGVPCVVEQTVQIAEGQTVTRDVTLPVNGVTGIVRLSTGTIPQGTGVIVDFSGGESEYSDLEEGTGRYNVWGTPSGVPAGEFTVTASFGAGNRALTIGTVQSTTDVAVVDVVFGKITGTVTYANGGGSVPTPAVFATQTLRPGQVVTYDARITREDGTYEVLGPQPGPITLTASKMLLEASTNVTLPSTLPVAAEVNLELEADGVVMGTLVDTNDALLPGVDVTLSIAGLDRVVKTDDQGRFRFDHVKRVQFTLRASQGTGPEARQVVAGGALSAALPEVTVPLKLLPVVVP